jgi:dihydrofolate synthase/folylpolyglutamate synthase
MARELSAVAAYAVTLKPDNPRSLDAELYAEEFRNNGVPAEGFVKVIDSVARAFDVAEKEKLPIVALGSLYMYCEVIEAL